MLRVILGIVLLVIAGGVGFFFGRHTHPVPSAIEAGQQQRSYVPLGESSTRSRTAEPSLTPPPTVSTPPTSLPNEQLPENQVPPPVAATSLPDARLPQSSVAIATPPGAQAGAQPASADDLLKRGIGLPIAGLRAPAIQDTFNESRGGGERIHEATDILAPRGTPVLAVDNGIVKKLFTSEPGGLTIYQYDSREEYCYYYAHLDRYAEGIKEGLLVKRGDVIGYVGTTGNADPNTPHLHFAILKLGPEKRWWTGTQPVNPYPVLMAALPQRSANRK